MIRICDSYLFPLLVGLATWVLVMVAVLLLLILSPSAGAQGLCPVVECPPCECAPCALPVEANDAMKRALEAIDAAERGVGPKP